MSAGRRRTAVLISGRGSNLAALIAATQDPAYPAEIALVVSDKANAGGLARADAVGIATTVIERAGFDSRAGFEAALDAALNRASIDLVCLAGFMRVLSTAFVERWRDRILNIHPSLLPAFPGLDTHARALAAGAATHGATVHLVRPAVDSGPIIVQGTVPVDTGDTPESLAARVLAVEHRIYPLALGLIASGRASLRDARVAVDPAAKAAHPDLIFPGAAAAPPA